jgi:hypothetical protein
MKSEEIPTLEEKKPFRYCVCLEDDLKELVREAKTRYSIDVPSLIRKHLREDLPKIIGAKKSEKKAG